METNPSIKKIDFNKVAFPLIMAVLAFICFVFVYWMSTVRSINPRYFVTLLFAIPSLIFCILTIFAWKGSSVSVINVLTAILVPVLAFSGFMGLMFMSFDEQTFTTDIAKYERVFRLRSNKLNKVIIEDFPKKIPETAGDVHFYYDYSAWLDFSETFVLRFTESSEIIDEYVAKFSGKCQSHQGADSWNGDRSSGDNAGGRYVGYETLYTGGIKVGGLPSDFTVYVIYETQSQRNFVSISTEKNQIIFFAQRNSRN